MTHYLLVVHAFVSCPYMITRNVRGFINCSINRLAISNKHACVCTWIGEGRQAIIVHYTTGTQDCYQLAGHFHLPDSGSGDQTCMATLVRWFTTYVSAHRMLTNAHLFDSSQLCPEKRSSSAGGLHAANRRYMHFRFVCGFSVGFKTVPLHAPSSQPLPSCLCDLSLILFGLSDIFAQYGNQA